jgi:uncharacterized protein (DUF1684 family)
MGLLGALPACEFAPNPSSSQNLSGDSRTRTGQKPVTGIDSEYARELRTWRSERDRFFKTDAQSPLKNKHKNFFSGMAYYPIDSATYRVTARLHPPQDTGYFSMKHTNGRDYRYRRYALAVFELKGDTHQLTLYQSARSQRDPRYRGALFLPFTDPTNGQSSYGGGRYIDLKEKDIQDSTVVIDFNRAYNPYCAYNSEYACPIPPGENRLSVPIKAGEKDFSPPL